MKKTPLISNRINTRQSAGATFGIDPE